MEQLLLLDSSAHGSDGHLSPVVSPAQSQENHTCEGGVCFRRALLKSLCQDLVQHHSLGELRVFI